MKIKTITCHNVYNTVSVIIPIYNVENYLRKCVDSVREQTYKNIQIILVDDGSTDTSSNICDEFSSMDSRITVIHKENGGLSSARNTGLSAAMGEFVFYLDSDDYLEPDAIATVLDVQRSSGADLVIGNYFYLYTDHEDAAFSVFTQEVMLTAPEAMEALISGKIQNFAWGKLIRANIAHSHLFPEGKLFEDMFWTHHVIHDCENVCILCKPIVHYRQRDNSISYSYTINRLDILEGLRARYVFLEEHYPKLVPRYLEHLTSTFLGIAWLTFSKMKKDRGAAFRRLRKFSTAHQLRKYAIGKEKWLIGALEINVAVYGLSVLALKFMKR